MKEFLDITKNIIRDFDGYYFKVFLLFILSLLSIATSLFTSVIYQTTIDQVFYARRIDYFFHCLIYILIGIFIFGLCLNILNSYVTTKVYSKMDSKFKLKYFEMILYSSLNFHNNHDSSEIYYRMFRDLAYLVNYYLDFLIVVPKNIIYVIGSFILMFYWSNVLSLIFIGILIMNVLIIILIKKPIYNINENQRSIEQHLILKVTNDLTKILAIKVFGIEKFQIGKMNDNFKIYVNANIKNNFLLSMLTVCSNLSIQIMSLLLIIVGAVLVYNSKLTIGAFISFSVVTSSTSIITTQLINTIFNYQITKLSYHRIMEYWNKKDTLEYGGIRKFKLDEGLFIRNISYKYPNSDKKVIDSITFDMHKGRMIAIIGENGKGKTTLVNLLDRLLHPHDGIIMLDDEHISDIEYEEFRNNVGYVLQQPIIFNDTILNNIILNKDNVPIEKVIDVLITLGIYPEIESLPEKLNTIIGENGYQLSVGNLQKITLARVFVRNYRILILDEPTASLDFESQKKFLELINSYKKEHNAIIILISHRENEITVADEKILL